jgi:hypothetical protein
MAEAVDSSIEAAMNAKIDQTILISSKVANLPSDFYYIPNFLTDLECDAILKKASNTPLDEQNTNPSRSPATAGPSSRTAACRPTRRR